MTRQVGFFIPPCPRATNQQRRTLGGHEVGSWRQPAPASANYPSSSSLFLPTFFDVVAISSLRACRRNVSLLTRKNRERTRNSSPASSRIALPSYSQTANLILLCTFLQTANFFKSFYALVFCQRSFGVPARRKRSKKILISSNVFAQSIYILYVEGFALL